MARADRATWAKRVERWKDSGLSAAEFAGELGISPNSLSWWKWQLARQDAAPTPATPKKRAAKAGKAHRMSRPRMKFVELPSVPALSELLEVVLPSGVRVRVPVHFDAVALGRLLETLGQPR
jgi:hypothetical protein